MADTAWFEVHALVVEQGRTPSGQAAAAAKIVLTGLQESALVYFQPYAPIPADWRSRDFGIRALILLSTSNTLYVQEAYADLKAFVKLKVK